MSLDHLIKSKNLVIYHVFEIGIFMYLFALIIDTSQYTNIAYVSSYLKIIRYIAYLFIAMKLLNDWYKSTDKKKFLLLIPLFILCILISYQTKSITFLMTIIVIVSFYNVEIMPFFKKLFYFNMIVILFVIVSSLMGIIPNEAFVQGNRIRYTLGFRYTYTINYFFYNMLLFFYVFKDKRNPFYYLIAEIIGLILFNLTDTKTSFAFIMIFLIFMYLNDKFNIFIAFKRIGGWSREIPNILSKGIILLCLTYNSYLSLINKFVNGRLYYAQTGLFTYGFPLFGNDIEWAGVVASKYSSGFAYNYVDISYVKILLEFGIIALALVIFLYGNLLNNSIVKGDYCLFFIVLLILLVCLIQPRLFDLAYNPFLLLLMNKEVIRKPMERLELFFNHKLHLRGELNE